MTGNSDAKIRITGYHEFVGSVASYIGIYTMASKAFLRVPVYYFSTRLKRGTYFSAYRTAFRSKKRVAITT